VSAIREDEFRKYNSRSFYNIGAYGAAAVSAF
jgi:hypothetical protein